MKTLANCTLAEFLKQSNKIRKSVADYLKETDILSIRQHQPELTKDMSDEEKQKAMKEQAKKNLSEMLDVALEEHTEKTIEVLGLMCFTEGEELEKLEPMDIIDVAMDILMSERVISFFMRLMQLDQRSTANTLQKSTLTK